MNSAKVIADSIAPNGVRLITLQLCYWRAIHGELMTHRVFSRGAMSSRAVPIAKMIAQVRNNPASSLHWGANQAGMQARAQLTGWRLQASHGCWRLAGKLAASVAWVMDKLGAHKQVVNRLLEPFQWMHTIVTATEFDNFFELRDHEDAEPNFQDLARRIRKAVSESTPVARPFDRQSEKAWHLPYITDEERQQYPVWLLARVSAARCARVSFLNHDGTSPDVNKDLGLYAKLVGSRPLHSGPVEHQGYPLPRADQWSRNLRGWRQHRELVEHAAAAAAAEPANDQPLHIEFRMAA